MRAIDTVVEIIEDVFEAGLDEGAPFNSSLEDSLSKDDILFAQNNKTKLMKDLINSKYFSDLLDKLFVRLIGSKSIMN